MLRPAASLEAFVSSPVGCYLRGSAFLRFCADPSLTGLVEWGRPEREDASAIVRALEADRALAPHAFLHDARRLAPQQDASAFSLALNELRGRIAQAPLPIDRIAVVIAPSLAGSVAAGFYAMLSRRLPVSLFSEIEPALDWLGAPSSLAAELDRLGNAVTGTPPMLFRLRELLEIRAPRDAAQAARALGVSLRSLQRHLKGARTSFREELNAARIRVAQRLLAQSDLGITDIALEVGCASSQHFSALFRRSTGESPSRWRRRGPATSAA